VKAIKDIAGFRADIVAVHKRRGLDVNRARQLNATQLHDRQIEDLAQRFNQCFAMIGKIDAGMDWFHNLRDSDFEERFPYPSSADQWEKVCGSFAATLGEKCYKSSAAFAMEQYHAQIMSRLADIARMGKAQKSGPAAWEPVAVDRPEDPQSRVYEVPYEVDVRKT
jgi:hypothetical protein